MSSRRARSRVVGRVSPREDEAGPSPKESVDCEKERDRSTARPRGVRGHAARVRHPPGNKRFPGDAACVRLVIFEACVDRNDRKIPNRLFEGQLPIPIPPNGTKDALDLLVRQCELQGVGKGAYTPSAREKERELTPRTSLGYNGVYGVRETCHFFSRLEFRWILLHLKYFEDFFLTMQSHFKCRLIIH